MLFAVLAMGLSVSAENYILYTSTDGRVIKPYKETSTTFRANIVSNTYKNGQGRIEFDGDVKRIGSQAFYNCSTLESIVIPGTATSIEQSAFSGCQSLVSVEIPESVTSIGQTAFYECSSLTSVEIPESVTKIGGMAFCCCPVMTAFYGNFASDDNRCLIVDGVLNSFARNGISAYTIPNTVTAIGRQAFLGCADLASIDIPESVTSIGSNAFEECSNLARVNLPNALTTIDDAAFTNCTSLTSIDIPNSVASSLRMAFWGCKNLTSVVIPESATEIGERAFQGCSNLQSVEIPNSIALINSYAFGGCTNLASIEIPNSVETFGYGAFVGCSSLESIKIPNSATTIPADMFKNCISLTSVVIPNSVTTIWDYAFSGCTNLISVEIPNSVTAIKRGAFENCTSLEKITIPASVTSIAQEVFSKSGVNEVHITSVEAWCNTSIERELFNSSRKLYLNGQLLTEVVIPGSVKTVQPYTFYGLALEKIVLEEGVEAAEKKAFSTNQCFARELHLPSTLTKFEDLGGSYIEELHLGSLAMLGNEYLAKLPAIQANAYDDYGNLYQTPGKIYIDGVLLTELLIPDNMTDVKCLSQLSSCLNSIYTGGLTQIEDILYVKKLEIGKKLKRINGQCPNVQLVISHAATPPTISEGTFPLCSFDQQNPGVVVLETPEMEDAYLSAAVWQDLVTSNMGNSLEVTVNTPGKLTTEIIYEGLSPAKVVKLKINGTINQTDFEKIRVNMLGLVDLDLTDLDLAVMPQGALSGKFQLQSLKLPTVCTELGKEALKGCSGLTSLTLPDGMAAIGQRALSGCKSLNSLSLPQGLRTISDNAFSGCSNLVSVDFNTGLESIGARAFYDVPLTSVYFQDGLLSIGDEAFAGSSLDQQLQLPETLLSIGAGAFRGQNIHGNLSLPENVSGLGAQAFAGTGISTVSLNSKIAQLEQGVFQDCRQLCAIYLPDNVRAINAYAFSGCESLADMRLSPSTTLIGVAAFQGSALRSAIIPDQTTEIQSETFDQCKNLRTVSIPADVTRLGDAAFRGCGALRNLTVKSLTPPTLTSSTFQGVNTNLCLISIPTEGFEDYALANYWGRFVQMRNDIAVEIEGEGYISYDSVDADNTSGQGAKAAARVSMPSETAEAENGSSVFVPKGGKINFYITPADDEEIISVTLDGEDITSEVVDGVYTTSPSKRGSKLVACFSGNTTLLGDVNRDGVVSVTDVVWMVDIIMEKAADQADVKAADLNGDGIVTVTDITHCINIIMNNH